ncbi:hypothetical protein LYZ37_07535 [Vibrio tubiashii]|uniref:hypothetical protein n=1 Tax=Vibrio tubiashii TaxID=29498 RepID=UPI00234F744D|nr:hypothetical protein [Vibrio tubiashii]WCP68570.1 hypothetical protein LYZ37_07535 [Vibrio tubiashii]
MESDIKSKIIGAIILFIIIALMRYSSTKKTQSGELSFGIFLPVIGVATLAFSIIIVWMFFNVGRANDGIGEVLSAFGLVVFFGSGSFVSFMEFFKVKGRFDSVGIDFYTPWTGAKKEKWENIVDVKYNRTMSWYVIQFKSGAKVRLSSYLQGHYEVVHIIKARGFDF